MQVSVEPVSGLKKKMTIQVPAERIDQEVDKRLQSMKGRVRIDGFRPGKVPMKVIKQRYGRDVFNEVAGEVIQTTFYEAVAKEELRPAGAPSIEPRSLEPGQPLEYEATFEVYPEFEPAALEGVEITRPVAEVTDADVDKMLESLRKQRMGWQEVDRPAKEGDQITVDFEGFVDGEPIEGGKAENMPILVGGGRLIPSLEEQLEGLKPGEEKTLEVTFPEDYHVEELAGKQAEFRVKVHKVEEPALPELDDAFARQFGIEEGGIEKLREEVRANMERELRQTIQKELKTQVMDALLERNPVEVPEALVAEEIKALREQMMQSLGQQMDASGFPDEFFRDEAERRVKLGLILGEIIRREEMKPEPERIDQALQDLAASYEDPQQVIEYYRSNPQAMASLESLVLEDQLVDRVLEQASVTEEQKDFDSIMNPPKEEQQKGEENNE
ncbi:MAG: trigger factor [Gammaproteobacteria bacterium]|nr:MAG: trigger factor [Gammaproteobacteria bacterium]